MVSIKNRKKSKNEFEIKKNNDYFLLISVTTPVYLLILKFFHSNQYKAIFVNFVLELSIYLIFYFLLVRLIKNSKLKFIKTVFKSAFLFIFIINTLLFAANSIYFDDVRVLKYDFTKANKEVIFYVLKNILIVKNYVIMFVILVLALLSGKLNLKFLNRLQKALDKRFTSFFLIILVLSVLLVILDFEDVANQYTTTLVFGASDFKHGNIKINVTSTQVVNQSWFRNPIKDYNVTSIPKNQRILVFVMEQTTFDKLLDAVENIPNEKNFFKITENHSIYFTNYYTQNQDSRTAIWDMLNSEFIPFECYLNNWNKYYGTVLDSNNLVDLFKSKGYKTVAASSVYIPNLIIAAYPWDDLIYLKEFDENNPDYICLHEFEFQQSCEDKILLPDLKKFLLENKNQSFFLFQELIAGHGENFVKLLGKHQIYYYNDYFLELYNFMKENNLLENTTIILVADHGNKGYFVKRLTDYQIPLIIINQNINGHKEIKQLFTHNDFKDILLDFLNGKEFRKRLNWTYIIGQTASNEIGYINSSGHYFIGLLKNYQFDVKRSFGLTPEEIQDKIEFLLAYQKVFINESLLENNYCKYCGRNIRLVESKRMG